MPSRVAKLAAVALALRRRMRQLRACLRCGCALLNERLFLHYVEGFENPACCGAPLHNDTNGKAAVYKCSDSVLGFLRGFRNSNKVPGALQSKSSRAPVCIRKAVSFSLFSHEACRINYLPGRYVSRRRLRVFLPFRDLGDSSECIFLLF